MPGPAFSFKEFLDECHTVLAIPSAHAETSLYGAYEKLLNPRAQVRNARSRVTLTEPPRVMRRLWSYPGLVESVHLTQRCGGLVVVVDCLVFDRGCASRGCCDGVAGCGRSRGTRRWRWLARSGCASAAGSPTRLACVPRTLRPPRCRSSHRPTPWMGEARIGGRGE